MRQPNRRDFLRSFGVAAGASSLAAGTLQTNGQSAAFSSRTIGANDRIRVALIGCGGMGRGDLSNCLRIKNVECIALCDVDERQIAKTSKSVVELVLRPSALMTKDFRRVIELKDLDAVIVATPDHWHALPTILACQAGKDVYVEKPLSLCIAEGRVMVAAARRYSRIVQMGTQQRSTPHFAEAVDYVRSGKLGRIRLVRAWAYLNWSRPELPVLPDTDPPPEVDYDFWLGPAPKRPFNENRFHFEFRWHWDYAGGLMTDWGAHMIDVANWAMGVKVPVSAASVGGRFGFPNDARETPDTQHVIWQYPEFDMVWEHALGIGLGPETREHGVAFHGNNGLLVVDRGGWEVHPETDLIEWKSRRYRSGGMPRQSPSGDDPHFLHVQNFIDCLRSRRLPASDVEIGHNSMIACHLGNIAFRLGRQVKWDAENERIKNDSAADNLVSRAYRAPWRLPSSPT